MSESNRSGRGRLLADALRREASAARPEFSASLHARLRQAVRGSTGQSPSVTPVYSSHSISRYVAGWALAAAAAVALLAAIFGRGWTGQPPAQDVPGSGDLAELALPPPLPPDAEADLQRASELASQAVEDLGSLVDAALPIPDWAELDDDAQGVLLALADRLPENMLAALAFSEPAGGQ
jgi:hypothetical protein